jgi:UDPglucose 6-dehydrogenase/GDP-mannose 6-dehydrogenase
VKALIAHGKKFGRTMQLLDAVMRINEQQPGHVISLLKKNFPDLRGIKIAVLGLAFKPGTDDLRESPALPIIQGLLTREARIRAYDPVANREAGKVLGNHNITYCDSLAQAIDGVQAVVLLTRWEEFKDIPRLLAGLDPQPLFIDGRRMLGKKSVARYEGIGL